MRTWYQDKQQKYNNCCINERKHPGHSLPFSCHSFAETQRDGGGQAGKGRPVCSSGRMLRDGQGPRGRRTRGLENRCPQGLVGSSPTPSALGIHATPICSLVRNVSNEDHEIG